MSTLSETLFSHSKPTAALVYSIPVASPWIDERDTAMVTKALRERRVSMGPYVAQFENKFADFCGTEYGVAASSGTAALHLALAAIGIRENDEVLVPSLTYVASANCILYQRARPVFVEVEPVTLTVDIADLERKVTNRARAIIAVHYGGQCADMAPILEIARKHNLIVIEDATEAHGALYKGKVAGSLGDMGCFSFTANKNMTTGEGGMVTTSDKEYERKLRLLRSQGQTRRYYHTEMGFNYRFTDFQAALGISQLRKLPAAISRKVALANRYARMIGDNLGGKIHPPVTGKGRTHTYMLYTVKFESQDSRDGGMKALEKAGIESRIAFPPIHLQPQYEKEYGSTHLPVTENLSRQVLSLPVFPEMTASMQRKVVDTLRMALK